jgi:prepilin-type processing-associated H-X9-DG protein
MPRKRYFPARRRAPGVLSRSGFATFELLIPVAGVFILAAILLPVFARARANARRTTCQSGLKAIGRSMQLYARDYDERLPPLAVHDVPASEPPYRTPFGWADAIAPYSSAGIFQCPEELVTGPQDALQNGFTDYWMNRNISQQKWKLLPFLAQTVLCGDGNDGHGGDARYNRDMLPPHWLQQNDSPAQRHLSRGNYLFVDGHVKALRPQQIYPEFQAGQPTFSLRPSREPL